MSLQVEKLEKNMAKLTIEVPAEELEKAIEKAYQKEKSRISIPGFRKGKAPRKLIEQMYGKEVFYEDAANALIPEAYEKELENCQEAVVSQPRINVVQIEAGKPFIFTAEVALKPEVTLGKYKGVEVDAAGEIGQGTGPVTGHPAEKFLHIAAGTDAQLAGELAVDRVLHDHVQDGAAVVHHDLQLPLHVRRLMAAGYLPPEALPVPLDHVAPGGGLDGRASGPQQGDVAHNELAAHAEASRQRGGADRPGGLGQNVPNRVPALLGGHGRFPLPHQHVFSGMPVSRPLRFCALIPDVPQSKDDAVNRYSAGRCGTSGRRWFPCPAEPFSSPSGSVSAYSGS